MVDSLLSHFRRFVITLCALLSFALGIEVGYNQEDACVNQHKIAMCACMLRISSAGLQPLG